MMEILENKETKSELEKLFDAIEELKIEVDKLEEKLAVSENMDKVD